MTGVRVDARRRVASVNRPRTLLLTVLAYLVVASGIAWIISGTLLEGISAPAREALLYGFLGVVAVVSAALSPADGGAVPLRRHFLAALLGVALAGAVALSLRATSVAHGGAPGLAAMIAATVSALFETAFVYTLTLRALKRCFSVPWAILLTSLLYAFYHAGYLAPAGQLGRLGSVFGTYVLVGLVNASLTEAVGSPLVLFPFYLSAATLFDTQRYGLRTMADPVALGTILGLSLLAVATLLLVRSGFVRGPTWPRRSERTAAGPTAARASADAGVAAALDPGLRAPLRRFDLFGGRGRVVRTLSAVAPLFVIGLFFRFIVNDPVPVEGATWVSSTALFVQERGLMVRSALYFGLAGYLLIPAAALAFFHDAAARDRKTRSPFRRLWPRLLGMALGTLGLTIILLVIAIMASLLVGEAVSGLAVLRFIAVGLAMATYAALASAWVLAVAYNTTSPAWSVAVSLLSYMIIYNYWMIYPLFSSYWSVALPTSAADVARFMAEVSQRSADLYAWVPQYTFYTSTAVATMRNPLAPEVYLPSFGVLAVYALGISGFALVSARGRVRS